MDHISSSLNTGFENLSNVILNFAQTQVEETVQTVQSLMSCRTLKEAEAVRAGFMQQSFDRLINEANKMAQKAAALARDKAQSIT